MTCFRPRNLRARTGNQNRVVSCPWNFRHLENNVPFATIPDGGGICVYLVPRGITTGPFLARLLVASRKCAATAGAQLVQICIRGDRHSIRMLIHDCPAAFARASVALPNFAILPQLGEFLARHKRHWRSSRAQTRPRRRRAAALTPIVLASGAKADPIDMTTLPLLLRARAGRLSSGSCSWVQREIEEDPRIRVAETGGEPADGPSAVSGEEGGATISSVSGDVGAHVYFSFYWQAAGDFAASVGVPNADEIVGLAPSYLFDLCAGLPCGPVLESVSADKSNDYQNELSSDDLAAGYYTVGIIAEGVAADPPYSVVFATPVIGGSVSSVPEPTTWTMLIVGFAGICSFGWLKSQKRSQTCLVGIGQQTIQKRIGSDSADVTETSFQALR